MCEWHDPHQFQGADMVTERKGGIASAGEKGIINVHLLTMDRMPWPFCMLYLRMLLLYLRILYKFCLLCTMFEKPICILYVYPLHKHIYKKLKTHVIYLLKHKFCCL